MNRYIVGSFVSAVALFLFGAIFWMSPVGSLGFVVAPDDDLAAVSVQTAFPVDGTYYVPGPGDGSDREGQFARHRAGPIATVHIRHEGAEPMSPRVLLVGFVHNWIVALLMTYLLVRAAPAAVARYGDRVLFVALVGVIAATLIDLGHPIWWYQPWRFHLVNAAYHIGGSVVVGLVLGAFVKPAAGAA